MLSLQSVTATVKTKDEEVVLLEDITADFHPGQLVAIVGPSGCGKTSLIKTIAGLHSNIGGLISWNGINLEKQDFQPNELGYVPQFSISCEDLTVKENLQYAADLRLSGIEDIDAYLHKILNQTGLSDLAQSPVKVLSGGQKRRLSLAIELTANPSLLLCDEVTSGLDLHSERQIVKLLKSLAKEEGKIILSVTHSLENLQDYDAVLVLHEGILVYHAPPEEIMTYFKAKNPSGIYHQLPQLSPQKWKNAWADLKKKYPISKPLLPLPTEDASVIKGPHFLKQTSVLINRRWKTFFRDKTQCYISIGLALGFPLLVILFSESGREPIRKLSDTKEQNLFLELQNQAAVHQDQLFVGSAVSGIIMFQVVLLCLMGSNNSAREISGERHIWEKERLAGVRPLSYLLSKLTYLGALVFIQSTVMAFLVEAFWQFRGNFLTHWMSLLLVNAAMTSICLAISSLFKKPATSSLMSVYLVGFQLPLSGAILTLPQIPEAITKPFISAYWAWSGSIDALQANIFSAVQTVSGTTLSLANTSFLILSSHIALGLIFATIGVHRAYID